MLSLKEGEISMLDVISPTDLARKLSPFLHPVFKQKAPN